MPILIVALVIGIIMATTAILPLASDYSEAKTFSNEGYFYVDSVEDGESINYVLSDGILTINGVAVAPPSSTTYPDGLTVFYTEHIVFRYDGGAIKIRGQVNSNATAINLVITEGTITGTYTSSTGDHDASWTYTEFVGMVTTEESRIMAKNTPQYINSDSLIDTTGLSHPANMDFYVIHLTGSMDDGMTINLYNQSSGAAIDDITVSNIAINTIEVEGYIDLYKLNSVTFTLTDTNEVSSDVTFTVYTVPAEVTADPDNPDTYKNLIEIVPLMAFIMLVVAAAAMIISKRD